MNFLQKIILLLTAFFLFSCGIEKANKTINTDDKYQIDIPITFFEDDYSNDDASLFYQNPISETYVMVVDELYEEFDTTSEDISLADYLSGCKESWEEIGMHVQEEDCRMIQINGLPAIFIEKEAIVEGVNIYYNIALVKGKKGLYQVITWTLPTKKQKNQKVMTDMIYSFKEL